MHASCMCVCVCVCVCVCECMRACITCHPVVDLPVIGGFVDERVIHLELAVSQLVEEQSCKCAAQHTKH